jgi:hypothetical protein
MSPIPGKIPPASFPRNNNDVNRKKPVSTCCRYQVFYLIKEVVYGDFHQGHLFRFCPCLSDKNPGSSRIIENAGQLKKSLDALKKMPIRTVYPGHGKPFLMKELLTKL